MSNLKQIIINIDEDKLNQLRKMWSENMDVSEVTDEQLILDEIDNSIDLS